MDRHGIIAAINEEIKALEAAKAILGGSSTLEAIATETAPQHIAKRRGRIPNAVKEPKKTGGMTDEGRKRIADAMKARWAAKRAIASAPAKKSVKK